MQVSEKLIGRIRSELLRLTLLENEPMSAHCSFRIGGPARLMACPASASEAAALLHILHEEQAPTELMGKGTNLLVPDTGLDAVVVLVGEAMSDAELLPDSRIRAGAGISLAKLAVFAAGCGLSGLEFAHGIPGSLGGAVFMNAGAYGGEMKDVVEEAECADAEGKLEVLSVSELQLSYRHSALEGTGKLVTSATLRLSPGEPEEIRARMRELMEKRRASQPLDLPSAGSTFKRPQGGFAAALIDQAGLKGFAIGGAQVSEKHAGFVVNRGGATFEDVTQLMRHIQKTVFDRSGIMLEPEVRILKG